MTKKIILSGVALVVLSSIATVAIIKFSARKPESTNDNLASSSEQSNTSKSTNDLQVNNSTNISGNLQQQNQTATTNLPEPTSNSSKPASNIPSPESFGQYDKYKKDSHSYYGDIVEGSGAAINENSKVAVYYKGWLTNGLKFDESKIDPKTAQEQPFIFRMGKHEVIPGWEESLFGMKVGGKRRLIIPPSLGYGAVGKGPVPADSVLIFDVELLAAQ